MENKKIMIVFYQTELDDLMEASYGNNGGIDVRRIIRGVWDKKGREIRMEQ